MTLSKNSSNTLFLQVSSDRRVGSRGIAALQNIAKMYRSGAVAKIATAATTRGFFDKVIADIDSMIALLRKEEAMDIEHRDRCQNAENKNKNDKEDHRERQVQAGVGGGRAGHRADHAGHRDDGGVLQAEQAQHHPGHLEEKKRGAR